MNVIISTVITNDDGAPFAKFSAEYAGVPMKGVLAIERTIVDGVVNPLLDLGEKLAAGK